jgi:putative membrane protein
MKKLIYTTAIFGAALMFQACGNNSGSSSDTSDTSAMATDSTAGAEASLSVDSADQKNFLADTTFASKAAIGGMAEVELGKLALEKGKDSKIRDFAAMMVKDHGKANEELKAIAKSKNLALPAGPDQKHKSVMDELETKSGADFDKAYAKAMVEGHQETLALMQQGNLGLKDAELKGFAAKTAPVVKHHLETISSIQAELK